MCMAPSASMIAGASLSSAAASICMPTSKKTSTLRPKPIVSQKPCNASTTEGERERRAARPRTSPTTTTAITGEACIVSDSSDVPKTSTMVTNTAVR